MLTRVNPTLDLPGDPVPRRDLDIEPVGAHTVSAGQVGLLLGLAVTIVGPMLASSGHRV
jgi:hypothetical protein